jgi:hypothetical protein
VIFYDAIVTGPRRGRSERPSGPTAGRRAGAPSCARRRVQLAAGTEHGEDGRPIRAPGVEGGRRAGRRGPGFGPGRPGPVSGSRPVQGQPIPAPAPARREANFGRYQRRIPAEVGLSAVLTSASTTRSEQTRARCARTMSVPRAEVSTAYPSAWVTTRGRDAPATATNAGVRRIPPTRARRGLRRGPHRPPRPRTAHTAGRPAPGRRGRAWGAAQVRPAGGWTSIVAPVTPRPPAHRRRTTTPTPPRP